jgi:dipeptidyl aminopeptidase/acylaminoacyl peptidase
LYWIWNGRSEFRQLALFDLETKVITTLTTAIPWDIDDYDISGDGRMIALLANEDGWAKLHFFDAESGRERLVPALAEGYYAHLVFRPGSQELGFEWSCSQAQSGIYSYDLDTGRRTEWVKPRPGGLKAGRTDEPELVRYPSFDGRMIPAFVQRPSTGSKGQKPYPVLIHIHGGPATQHRPHFSATDDYYLQHLGIAIVSPNVRGSTGYGRTYEELDNGKRREDALRDIGALLDWIATQPDLDVSRVATEGGSYGGFMALAALASYGDRLQAGIDSVGFSSLESFLQNRRPFELAHARFEFGDVRDPEMAAFFRKLSPLTNADKIHKPLLVIHGANDPRVRISEAEQIVSAVRQNGAPVWYIRMDAEGHGVGRIPDLAYEQQAEALFLKRFLLNAGPNAGASAGAEGTARAAGPPGPLEGDPRLGPIGAPSGLVSPRQRAPR